MSHENDFEPRGVAIAAYSIPQVTSSFDRKAGYLTATPLQKVLYLSAGTRYSEPTAIGGNRKRGGFQKGKIRDLRHLK